MDSTNIFASYEETSQYTLKIGSFGLVEKDKISLEENSSLDSKYLGITKNSNIRSFGKIISKIFSNPKVKKVLNQNHINILDDWMNQCLEVTITKGPTFFQLNNEISYLMKETIF